MKTYSSSRGFTIVELLIVIVVIGILAAITVVAFNGVQDRAHRARVNSDLRQAEKLMLMYRSEYGELPPDGDWYSGSTMPPAQSWNTQVLKRLRDTGFLSNEGPVRDPWGQYYWFDDNDCNTPAPSGASSHLRSVGKDGLWGTADDIGILIKSAC